MSATIWPNFDESIHNKNASLFWPLQDVQVLEETEVEAIGTEGQCPVVLSTPKKRRKSNPETWTKHQKSHKYRHGESYKYKNSKNVETVKKSKRDVNPDFTCCKRCNNQCTDSFDYDKKVGLNGEYWDLGDSSMQRGYLAKYVEYLEKKETSRKRPNAQSRKERKSNLKFTLPLGEEKKKVCRPFFLHVYNIDISGVESALASISSTTQFVTPDKRRYNTSKNITDPARQTPCIEHIKTIQTVESHYCRGQLNVEEPVQYLPRGLTYKQMWRNYKKWCQNGGTHEDSGVAEPIKSETYEFYLDVLKRKFNIKRFIPKKDLCDQCTSFSNIDSPTEEMKVKHAEHRQQVERSRNFRSELKEQAKSVPSIHVAVFDLQKTHIYDTTW